ncbi:MAG: hypothetical protein IJC10_03230 [Clostridia bacterium]|nr:hypothetical protein [Clostridia bacterium]
MVYLLFLFIILSLFIYIMVIAMYPHRLSVAQEVAGLASAASGGCSEDDMAQRSILCERSMRANKIGHRKKKHDGKSDVTGIKPLVRLLLTDCVTLFYFCGLKYQFKCCKV